MPRWPAALAHVSTAVVCASRLRSVEHLRVGELGERAADHLDGTQRHRRVARERDRSELKHAALDGALRGEEQPSGRGRRRQRAGDVGDNAGVAGRADLGAAKVVKDAAAVPVGDRDVVAQVRSSTSSQRFSWMTRKPTPRGSGLGTAWRYRNPPS
jgi:hypothetical protein